MSIAKLALPFLLFCQPGIGNETAKRVPSSKAIPMVAEYCEATLANLDGNSGPPKNWVFKCATDAGNDLDIWDTGLTNRDRPSRFDIVRIGLSQGLELVTIASGETSIPTYIFRRRR